MLVHRKDGTIMKFQECRSGLCFYEAGPKFSSSVVSNYHFLNTAAENKCNHTLRKIQGANKARALCRKIGRPSEINFKDILEQNLIRNCPVTPDHAHRGLVICGPDIATLEGKTIKTQNKGIPNHQAAQIPAPIIALYKNLRLFTGIFWANGSPCSRPVLQ